MVVYAVWRCKNCFWQNTNGDLRRWRPNTDNWKLICPKCGAEGSNELIAGPEYDKHQSEENEDDSYDY